MTGLEDFGAEKFDRVAEILEKEGFTAFNPLCIGREIGFKKPYLTYMAILLPALIRCDAIYLLDNWKKSRGARFEYLVAKFFQLQVIYEKKDIIDAAADFILGRL